MLARQRLIFQSTLTPVLCAALRSELLAFKADAILSYMINAFTVQHCLPGVRPAIEQCEISGTKGQYAAKIFVWHILRLLTGPDLIRQGRVDDSRKIGCKERFDFSLE